LDSIKVANVLGYMARRYGGPPQSMYGLGRALEDIGVKVSYWATGNSSENEDVVASGRNIHLYKTAWPHKWFRAPAMLHDLSRRIKSIDILHIQGIWSYPQCSASRVARRFDIPYLMTPRGVLEPWRIRHKGHLKFIKKIIYLGLVGKTMLQNARCLHALALNEVEGFRKIGYDGPVTVVPNGVNPEDFSHLPNKEEAELRWPNIKGRRVILFLSRLSKEKGLDRFLPAFADIAKRNVYKDVLLVLAGPDLDGYGKTVKNLINKHKLNKNVLLTGMITGRPKAELISRADIYALPSYSEGFSMSLLENMASGTPALITEGCNFPEFARSNAGLCMPCKREALKEGLIKLLDMPAGELKAMGRKGRQLVLSNYTWQVAARKMVTVYRCILEGKDIPLNPEPFINETHDSRIMTNSSEGVA
jgi:glycosyltransferase involved in cell wall biosynthesis